ncbi:hypothetical protein HPB47_011073 [Ixodes persulcatus]|uniref:Uncharacterized protein n=1 Tax=Ixodes persulcatus TaxID=34615 RepID=A0AC60NXG0_IXOPE|nr:hypothetical protein HPB47_011073 [Ixodes persulcatus]
MSTGRKQDEGKPGVRNLPHKMQCGSSLAPISYSRDGVEKRRCSETVGPDERHGHENVVVAFFFLFFFSSLSLSLFGRRPDRTENKRLFRRNSDEQSEQSNGLEAVTAMMRHHT